MVWNPYNLPTAENISNFDIFLGIALMNIVLASGSKA